MDFLHKKTALNPLDLYHGYDYAEFWEGRSYEDSADKIAISRLLSLIDTHHNKILDLGVGIGRIMPIYQNLWKNLILVDSSLWQIKELQKKKFTNSSVEVLEGAADNIPISSEGCDTLLCVRVFHHINNTKLVIKEMYRVLELRGYVVLEIPNKLHFKNRLASFFRKNGDFYSEGKVNIAINNQDVVFLNHSPKFIKRQLMSQGFQIVETLSVSNFRLPFLKRFIPLPVLIRLEKIVQKPFALFWFGPSIYFLAKKIS